VKITHSTQNNVKRVENGELTKGYAKELEHMPKKTVALPLYG